MGNLLSVVYPNGVVHIYAYDNPNQVTSEAIACHPNNMNGNVTYGYDTVENSCTDDSNGNTLTSVTGSNTTTCAWDFENRLTSVTLPGTGGTVSFKYDPFGRRIYKSSSTATSVYAYDGDNLIEETNSSGAVVARYEPTQNIDEPLAMLRSGTTSYYHADGLGSITSLSNAAGSLAQTYQYDSFGKQTATSGSLTNPFQYTDMRSKTLSSSLIHLVTRTASSIIVSIFLRGRSKASLVTASTRRRMPRPSNYPPSPPLSSLTQSDVVGGSNSTPLNQSLPFGAGGTTIHGPWGSAILLGPNAFIPSNDPDATYLHELLHAAYLNLNDDQLFNLFKPFGLKHLNPGSYDITVWIMSNCKNTVTAK